MSGGMTGATYGKGRTHAPNSSFVKFDTSEYISTNIAKASDFDYIVVSTWDFEDTSKINIGDNAREKTHIILNVDPTPNAKKLRAAIDGVPHAHELNKVRQFYSTHQGIIKLKELGCTHALKIRTDQLVPVNQLFRELEEFAELTKRGLVIPGLRRDNPLIINDFYLGGTISDFEIISSLMCNLEFQFHENVHIDLFYKTIWGNPSLSLGIPFINYFLDNGRNCKKAGEFFGPITEELFHPASQEIYKTIQWRGERLSTVQSDMVFRDTIPDKRISRNNDLIRNELNFRAALVGFTGDKSILKFLLKFIQNSLLMGVRNFRRNLSTFRDLHGIRLR